MKYLFILCLFLLIGCEQKTCVRDLVILKGENRIDLVTYDQDTTPYAFMNMPKGIEIYSTKIISPIKEKGSFQSELLHYIQYYENSGHDYPDCNNVTYGICNKCRTIPYNISVVESNLTVTGNRLRGNTTDFTKMREER